MRSTLAFFKDSLVFGAVIFSYLLNLCFLAAAHDLRLEQAYQRLSHAQAFPPEMLARDLVTVRTACPEGRRLLHPGDTALLDLARRAGPLQAPSLAALQLKLKGPGLTLLECERALAEGLPTAESPELLPRLQRFFLLYAWVVEILVLAALSQALRDPEVQRDLHTQMMRPGLFIPAVTVMLLAPLARYPELALAPGQDGPWAFALTGLVALLGGVVLHWRARSRLQPQQLPELGIYLLIVSLFVQLVAILAGAPWSLGLLNQPHMQLVRGLCHFILVCCPLMLLEKWWTSGRSQKPDACGDHPIPTPREPGRVDTSNHTPKH